MDTTPPFDPIFHELIPIYFMSRKYTKIWILKLKLYVWALSKTKMMWNCKRLSEPLLTFSLNESPLTGKGISKFYSQLPDILSMLRVWIGSSITDSLPLYNLQRFWPTSILEFRMPAIILLDKCERYIWTDRTIYMDWYQDDDESRNHCKASLKEIWPSYQICPEGLNDLKCRNSNTKMWSLTFDLDIKFATRPTKAEKGKSTILANIKILSISTKFKYRP